MLEKQILNLGITAFLISSSLLGQAIPRIAPGGVFNSASYVPACQPNHGIAQGSVFVVFGEALGPTNLTTISRFPLQPLLSETLITVTVNGISLDALPLYVSATQVAAILPSRTPVGNGTIAVRYQGRTSPPAPIKVVRSAFGLYTVNQAGSGRAVGQNVLSATSLPLNSSALPARPGELMILWGTGLGPVTGDEAAGALPNEPRDANATVWVGNQKARITYQGRSGCCAGLDQIVFEVPNLEGCDVPISVEINGVSSNSASISVAAPGKATCPEYSEPKTQLKPNFSLGILSFIDLDLVIPGFPLTTLRTVGASFEKIPSPSSYANSFYSAYLNESPVLPAGSCWVSPDAPAISSTAGATSSPALPLNAGASLRLTTPQSSLTSSGQGQGQYSFSSTDSFYSAGRYRLDGTGGSDVGAFSFVFDVSYPKLILNQTRFPRSQDLTLRWTVPPNPSGLVGLTLASQGACSKPVYLSCYASAAAGQITIPSRLLLQLPVTSSVPSVSGANGEVAFGPISPLTQRSFSARGLDLGIALIIVSQNRSISFE